MKKTFVLYVRKCNIIINDSHTYVYKTTTDNTYAYKTTTDNIYRIIGKIYVTSLEKIDRISYREWNEKTEKYLKDNGINVIEYKEKPMEYEDAYTSEQKSKL